MKYRCVDRGGMRCPCGLMKAGQCYVCTLSRTGKCDCSADWQGVCPYNEYLQGAENPADGPGIPTELNVRISGIKNYSKQLSVVRLTVSRGLAWRCHRAGSFITASALGCRTPLSVLRTGFCYGKCECEKESTAGGWIEIALQPAGPKTKELIRLAEQTGSCGNKSWKIAGPFEAGLLNIERLNMEEPMTVIAKGTAIAPFINMMDAQSAEKPSEVRLLVDEEKLTEEFIRDYICHRGKHFTWKKVSLEKDSDIITQTIDQSSQIMLLASPYYTEKYFRLRPDRKDDIITANHANMCCGAGICGACSFTDGDGITVRRCKCV